MNRHSNTRTDKANDIHLLSEVNVCLNETFVYNILTVQTLPVIEYDNSSHYEATIGE